MNEHPEIQKKNQEKSKELQTFEEVGLEVNIEDVTAETLDGVVEGKDVYALAVLDVQARVHVDHVAKLDTEVVTGDLVHLDFALLDIVRAQADEHSIVPLLAAAHNVRK